MRARSLVPVLLALGVAACAPEATEHTGRTSASILGGRASNDDENANVFIETVGDDGTLRCSGRILAPRLVLSARHCFLKRKSENVRCSPDGSPADISDTTDLRPEPAERVTVYVGSEKPNLRPIAVREVITMLEVTLCRSDIAFLLLEESPLDARTPLRRQPVAFGDEVTVTGWGYTSDARDALPLRRSTLEGLRINDVGPGRIPQGTFATGGNSVCLGDSGAVALIDGAVVGTYSRIDGDPGACSLAVGRNIFTATAAQVEITKRAFAAIGEEPWYAGEPPPWLAAAGAACSRDDECRSGTCDPSTSTCAVACGDTGRACPSGQVCSEQGSCVTSDVASGAERSEAAPAPRTSCSALGAPSTAASPAHLALALALPALVLARRRRS